MALRQHGAVFQFLGNPLILEFLFGVAIAYAPAFQPARWGIPLGAALLIGAGFFDLAPFGNSLEYLRGEEAFQRVAVFGLPAALIVWGAMQFKGRESFWTGQGDASYALYLTHALFMPVFFCDLESDPPANRRHDRDQHGGGGVFRLAHPSGH